ncbi:MAG: OPT/YSL family transporter [Krumholzibacteria bacterium]|nr:OPT/YSL family transporter [Candidatus Krumholzibacteria bacterium]
MNDTADSGAGQPAGGPTARPLRVDGFAGTPAEIERQWYETVYRGRGDSMPQLTVRAVVMGLVLGGFLSLTNLYIGLKAGWSFGVAITAALLSYASWSLFRRIGLARTPMTILETNCMQSTASAAGYSTGNALISAFAAYVMINGHHVPLGLTLGWIFIIAALGVTMAIPMKRQMINIDQLRFPSGIAAAATLHTIHMEGAGSTRPGRTLLVAGLAAAINQFWMDGLHLVSGKLAPFGLSALFGRLNAATLGPAWTGRTVLFLWDPIFIAAGALMGLRVSASVLAGGVLCWMVFVPLLQGNGTISGTGFGELVQWTLWGGVSCMVCSSLLAVLLQWRSIVAAFGTLGRMFRRRPASGAADAVAAVETPLSWFVVGQALALVAICWLAKAMLGMPIWQSVLAVALTFLMGLVACRVTGETDTTPAGPLGKITQLVFGVVSPGNMNVNLMSASITANAAMASADLLTDLKCGYLLGANPRKQFLAQFAGIFMGTVATVLAFRVLVPDASVLGTDRFPAPAGQSWRAVALALGAGLDALEPVKAWSILVGGAVGVVLTLLPHWFPRERRWLPSAAGLGLAWTFPWYLSLLFFSGGLAGHLLARRRPSFADEFTWPAASGVIAGGSLMGVFLVLWENGPDIVRRFFGN